LQELLPFPPLLQLATKPYESTPVCSSGAAAAVGVPGSVHATAAARSSVLALLVPAQRAWLLADAAAAVMLPAEHKDG
jgi:hypothetical protein